MNIIFFIELTHIHRIMSKFLSYVKTHIA